MTRTASRPEWMRIRPSPAPRAALPLAVRSVGRHRLPPEQTYRRGPAPAVQLFWSRTGSGSYLGGDGRERHLVAQQLWIYPAGSEHLVTAGDGGFDFLWWTVDGPLAAESLSAFGLVAGEPLDVGAPPEESFARLDALLSDVSIPAEYDAAESGWHLLRLAAEGRRQRLSDDELAERCRRRIDQAYTQASCGIDVLARELGVHRSVLSRRFHAAHGQSPIAYLKARRLQRCLALLSESRLPIAEIARRCGYASPHYCARVVRQATGHAPRELRSHARGGDG